MPDVDRQQRRQFIEDAFFEYQRRLDAGEAVDRPSFLAQHADIADSLSAYLDADAAVRNLAGPTYAQETRGALEATSVFAHDGQRRGAAADPTGETLAGAAAGDTHPGGEPGNWGIPQEFGRYRIERLLGQGAMGSVYLAHDTQLDRRIALKIPKFDQRVDENLLERFYREARAVATLHHPNICPVYDVGEIDGRTFLSMGFIEGRPLSDYTKSGKQQSERSVAKLVMKLALALREAHAIGVVHRDLKPANVMVNKRGEPVVMDFGLARRLDSTDTRVTRTGTIVGTPAYMSPEQVEGDPDAVGPASDQYSLGVILYEMLTGQLPFQGSVLSVIGQIVHKNPRQVEELRSGLDPRLAAICRRMMAKDPADRYADLSAAAEALNTYLAESKTGAASADRSAWGVVPQQEALAPAKSRPRPAPDPVGGPSAKRRPSRPWKLWTALGAGALVAAFVAAVVLFVQTPEGVVRIEITDPETSVAFAGRTFTFDDNGAEVEVTPGKHTLHVKRGSLSFETQEFTVERNGETAIKVTWQDGELAAKKGSETIGVERAREAPPATPATDFALQFDGVDDFVEMPTLIFHGTHPITAEAQVTVFPPAPGTEDRMRAFLHFPWQLGFVLTGNQQFLEGVHPRPENFVFFGKTPVVFGKRMHVALVHDAGGMSMFVNGRQVGHLETVMEKDFDRRRPLRLGAGEGTPACFIGTLDEIRISRGARYTEDFTPSARLEADENTLALYHCDEGGGATLKDASGHGHDGEIHGATWVRASGAAADTSTDEASSSDEITLVHRLEGHRGSGGMSAALDVSADGRWMISAGGNDKTARLWDLQSKRTVLTLAGPPSSNACVAISSDGKRGACLCYEGQVAIWSLETGKRMHSLAHEGHSSTIAFSPSGRRLIAIYQEGMGIVWDVESGEELGRHDFGHHISACIFLNDDQALVGSNPLSLWDIASGEVETKWPTFGCGGMAISADGGTLATSRWDKAIQTWDMDSGEPIRRFNGHTQHVVSVQFLPNQRYLISGGTDGRLILWDHDTGREVARKENVGHLANTVLPLPDGRHAVSFGWRFNEAEPNPLAGDYGIRLWRLPESVWPQEAEGAEEERPSP
jgi:WD40 repeat protein/tRNA A-37 threonylcarbamoyl transferase component Bud32